MKIIKRIILIVLLLIVVLVVAVGIWQKNNIAAVRDYMRYSDSELAEKINTNRESLQELLQQYAPQIARDFTAEEEKKILSGEITPEEAVALLLQKPSENKGETTGTTLGQENNGNTKVDAIIGKHVAQLYSYKAQYLGALGGLEKSAMVEFSALPKEQQTSTAKKKILAQKLGQAAALESECDSQVNAILSSLGQELRAAGGNLEIIDTIRSAYEQEKSLKKAYYLKLMG